jgi:membrane-associated HD superfamily phosphohydrolase
MRAPFLIRFARLLSSPTALAGFLFPALLVAQTAERALQYQVGETARETIVANETIRVKDPEKQPNVRVEVRNKFPPVYGYTSKATADASAKLTRDWKSTQEQFLDSLERVYGKRSFRTVETTSQTFTDFIDNFQAENSGFPFYDGLARRWATGNPADDELATHIERLNTFMTAYFIRPDEAPELADTTIAQLDLITVKTEEPTTVEELEKYPTAKISPRQFIPISQAREIFLRQSDIQNRKLKIYLSQYILPNTRYLEAASIDRRNQTQSSLNGEIVFESGDIIVRQGEEITPIIKEALDLMIVGLRFARIKDSVKIELAREPGSTPKESTVQEDKAEETSPSTETPLSQPREESIEEKPEGKLPPILSPTTVAESNQSSKPTPGRGNPASELATPTSSGGLISSFYSLWV